MKLNLISVFLVAILLLPAVSYANHNNDDWGESVDRSELDDDVVDSFSVPVLFRVDYENLIPDFGAPRGTDRSHEGQDMVAPKGTPIVSPTEAVVIRTGDGSSSGLYVYTANPGGETFRYMHLNSIADIDSGDKLNPGDLIDTVGDTGNAPDGVYHLHFEVRDEDNEATDPHPRMTDSFSLQEKISFLEDILKDVDENDYAEFLTETFPAEFKEALGKGYDLPEEIEEALSGKEIVKESASTLELLEVLNQIPLVLQDDIAIGDQNIKVSLLQIYLIYTDTGEDRDRLLTAGPTGYYGSLTAGAVESLQSELEVRETGVYDEATRKALLNRTPELNLN